MLIKAENVVEAISEAVVYENIKENPILNDVLGVLIKQTAKGMAKYPNTVDVDDYTAEEWIDHAIEESIDKIVYLTALKHKMRGDQNG